MAKLQQELDKVDKKVATLRATFEQRTTEATKLKVELEKVQATLAEAESLVTKLEKEHQRWNDQVSDWWTAVFCRIYTCGDSVDEYLYHTVCQWVLWSVCSLHTMCTQCTYMSVFMFYIVTG